MLVNYLPLAILIIIATVLSILVVVIGSIFGPKRTTKVKQETYESGMTPYGEGTRKMPVRFWLVAVLFILFDLEIVFVFPWAVVFRELGMAGLLSMFFFLTILTVGLVYEWKKGALDWD